MTKAKRSDSAACAGRGPLRLDPSPKLPMQASNRIRDAERIQPRAATFGVAFDSGALLITRHEVTLRFHRLAVLKQPGP